MADYNQNIDYAAEIKRIKAQDPNANVNALIDAGMSKLNADPALKAKYGGAWDQLANQYRTNVQQAPTVAMASPQASAQDYINQLNEARKQQTIAALGKSRDESLSRLNAEKATIQPRYYDARNDAAAGSQQQARNFAEYMAARGGSSGAAAQAELSRVGTLQGALGNLGRQETAAYDDIDRRTTDVHNAYNSDLASAQAGIEADRMSALLQDFYIAQQRGDTLAQNAIQNELARAGMTGYLGGQRTIQGQQLDRNIFESDRNFNYQQTRDQRRDFESDRLFDYGVYRDNVSDSQWQQQFEQSAKQFAQQMGYNWASLNQRERQIIAEQTAREADRQYQQVQNLFAQGMETFKSTNQMPDFMSQFGIDVNKFNNSNIDQYDLAQVEALAKQSGITKKSSDKDVRTFVAGLKAQEGWSTDEAQRVEEYLLAQQVAQQQASKNITVNTGNLPKYLTGY